VALLEMVLQGQILQGRPLQKEDLVIAHFDHGIREVSANDAELVKNLAVKYQIEYVVGHGQLGKTASEQLARTKRYDFLRNLCKGDPCKIVTAHHQDDLLETILMNLIRGTGWRGLTPFWSDDIERPLLGLNKAKIVSYAIENDLSWVEDDTNYSAKYFRNRVRDFVARLSIEQKKRLLELNQKQTNLRTEIEKILDSIPKKSPYKVKSITGLPDDVAIEVLNKITDSQLTAPQLKRLLNNLRNVKSGNIFQPGGKIQTGVHCGSLTISKIN
jgi:tRNA(Ile)-lysidine synthetase-like protein